MRHFNLESLDLLLSSLDLKSLVIFIAFPTEKSKREKKIRFTSLWLLLIYLYGRRLCHPLNRLHQIYTLGTNGEEDPLLSTAEGSAPAPTNYRMIRSGVPLVEEKKK